MAHFIKCKNCEYFKGLRDTNFFHKDYGGCESEMVESLEDWHPPKLGTRIIIKVPDKGSVLFLVHRNYGCLEGLVREKIDRRRGRIR